MELVKVSYECGHTVEVHAEYAPQTPEGKVRCYTCRNSAWKNDEMAIAAQVVAEKDAAMLELRRPLIEQASGGRAWARQEVRENG